MTAFKLSFSSPPRSDESLNGYFLRLSGDNFLASPSDLLKAIGIRGKTSYSEKEVEEIAIHLDVDLDTMRSVAGYDALRSSIPDGYFNRKKHVPLCPLCLKDDAYIRQAWHHQLIKACAVHETQLLHVCPECASPFDIARPRVDTCRCGSAINAAPDPATAEDLFIAKLLCNRSGPLSLPGFVSLPPDFDQFWLFLANLVLPTPSRKNAAIDFDGAGAINHAAYRFALDLPASFKAFVEKAVDIANEKGSGSFFAVFGSWYRELNRHFAGEDYQLIRQVAHQVVLDKAKAPINRKMKQISGEMLGLKSCFTSAEAARILRSSPDRIVGLVKSGALEGRIIEAATIEYCLVDRLVVEAHQTSAQEFVSRKELQKLLGTTRRVTDRLIELGIIGRVAMTERPLFAKGEFLIEDAMSLIGRLAERTQEQPCRGGSISFDEISGKRFPAQTANMIYRRIFAGDISPHEQRSECRGLAAFTFDDADLLAYKQLEVDRHELTITDLTRITGWKHETIKSWIEHGFLAARKDSKSFVVSLADLVRFMSEYVVLADAAVRLNSKAAWLCKPLGVREVLPRGDHATKEGTRRGLLLSVDALLNVASGRAPAWKRDAQARQGGASKQAESVEVLLP